MTLAAPARSERELYEANRAFYEGLWSGTKLVGPERFNTWPLVSELVTSATRRLEVAPGLRPRLPIAGTYFADISTAALSQLSRRGGIASVASVMSLPYDDASFDLVAALDIIEHVEDDGRALAELSRVSAPGAAVLIAARNSSNGPEAARSPTSTIHTLTGPPPATRT
jgi:SAM-dependent methyltransferase